MTVETKRIYDALADSDGYRVLVDRVWPRGIRKSDAALDEWRRDLAPSTELRKWFGHDPQRWSEFQRRYETELAARGVDLDPLVRQARDGTLTLVYAARDRDHNNARVLQRLIRERL